MKEILNDKFKQERIDKISKEIDDRYNEYVQMYSSGFSIKELEKELFLTREEIMVMECRMDVLEKKIKVSRKDNYFIDFGISILSIIFNLVFKNKLLGIIFLILNLFVIIFSFIRIKELKLAKVQRNQIFKLKKESLYLELKMAVIYGILIGTI